MGVISRICNFLFPKHKDTKIEEFAFEVCPVPLARKPKQKLAKLGKKSQTRKRK